QPGGHHVGTWPEALSPQVGRDARQVAEVDVNPRTADEGAAGPSPAAVDEALMLKPVENLAHSGAAHGEFLGEVALGGQPSVLAQLAAGDQLLDVLLDRVADGAGILDPGSRIGFDL